MHRRITFVSLCILLSGLPEKQAAERVSFSREIQPILAEHCYHCHGPDENARKGKLRLDTHQGALSQTVDGAIIEPGVPAESLLYQRITSNDPNDLMPPPDSNRQLTKEQIALIKDWILDGASWSGLWSFAAPTRPAVPQVRAINKIRNPIDNFIVARLEAEGFDPSPEASRETLIRRAGLDLTGLPPTIEEWDEYVKDRTPRAYERWVDYLLELPAFGERMAWDWLDAARYADSNGYQGDSDRTMWPWRDWVVDAFNRNLPYDDFTTWQLAGDMLPEPAPEHKLATGFSRNHMINGEGGRIPEENRVEYVMDMTETAATVWLGLTFNCNRCHDHKFDPLTQEDYFGLSAFFNQTPVDGSGGNPQTPPIVAWPSSKQARELARINEEVSSASAEVVKFEARLLSTEKTKENLRELLSKPPGQRSKTELAVLEKESAEYAASVSRLRTAAEQRDNLNNSVPKVMVMQDRPEPRETFILERGIYDKRGKPVSAKVPEALPDLPEDSPANRLTLARWLVSSENPLTARVTVNRIWQQFFGTGLVKTSNDFGVQGEKPSHPELLDWLAVEFIESGWDVKHLCRLIVTSATYRQSSKARPDVAEHDPDNRLLARSPRYRWPSWMLRDQALAASGLLVREVGGEPVRPYQPAGVWEEATFGNKKYRQDHGSRLYRRSIYTFWRRIVGPTMFFDTAARQVCTVKQPRTNTPLHALATLNDVTYVEAARALAESVLRSEDREEIERIDRIFRTVLLRQPTERERDALAESLKRLTAEFTADPAAAREFIANGESAPDAEMDPVRLASYAGLCLAVFNLDEAMTKE